MKKGVIILGLVITLIFLSNNVFALQKYPTNKIDISLNSYLENYNKEKDIPSDSKNIFSVNNIKNQVIEKIPIIIKLSDNASMTEVYNSLQQQGVEIKYSLQLINSIAADVSFNTIEILANDEYIKKIYLDRKIQILPQDIIFERKNYELNRKIKNEEDRPITPMLYESTKLIDAPFMWDLGFNGSGVKIAILDTGIDDTHPDLEGKVVAKRDFTLFDNELKTEDGNGHGTHVAGIAAGTGAGSVKDIDTSSTDTSGLSNLPFSPNTYHVGAGIFQFDWEEETVVDVFLGQVDENSGFTYDFVMGDNISSFTVTISWLDSSDDIDMRLRNPAGDIYAWSIGVTNYESIHVENPEQGTWSLEVYPYSVTGTVNVDGNLSMAEFNEYNVLVVDEPSEGNVTLLSEYPDSEFDFETLFYTQQGSDLHFHNYSMWIHTWEGGIIDMGENLIDSVTCSEDGGDYNYGESIYLDHTYCILTNQANFVKIYVTDVQSDHIDFSFQFQSTPPPIILFDVDGDFNTRTDQVIASNGTHLQRTEKICYNYSWGDWCYYDSSYDLLFGISSNFESIKLGFDLNGDNQPDILKGVAPAAELLNGKVLSDYGGGYDSGIIAGIEWAVSNKADIISLSLGGWENICDGSDPLSEAVEKASDMGVTVVVAAGNSGYGRRETLGSPGCADKIITVGSSSKYNYDIYIAFSSSQGPTADGRIKPEMLAPGISIIAPQARGTHMSYSPIRGYISASGTSMATPHVAGAVALLKQIDNSLTPQEIKQILMNTATDLAGESVFRQGAGIINMSKAHDVVTNSNNLASPSILNLILKNTETKIIELSTTLNNPRLSAVKDESVSIIADQFNGEVNKTDGFVYNFTIDSETMLFMIYINWSNNSNDVDMRLRNPAGDIYAWSIGVTNYESIHVENPEQGTWSLEVYPYSVTGTVNVEGYLELGNLVEWNWFNYNDSTNELTIDPDGEESGLYSGKITLESNSDSTMIPTSIIVSEAIEFRGMITHSYPLNPCNGGNSDGGGGSNSAGNSMESYVSFDGYFCEDLLRKAYSFEISEDIPYFDIFLNWWTPSNSYYEDLRIFIYNPEGELYDSIDYPGEYESTRVYYPSYGNWTFVVESEYTGENGIIFSGEISIPSIILNPSILELNLRQGENSYNELEITNTLKFDLDLSIDKIIWEETPIFVYPNSEFDNSTQDQFSYSYDYYSFNISQEQMDNNLKSMIIIEDYSIYRVGAYIFDAEGMFIDYIYNYDNQLTAYHQIPNSAIPGTWTMVIFTEGFNLKETPIDLRLYSLNSIEWNWTEISEPSNFFKGKDKVIINVSVPNDYPTGESIAFLSLIGAWWKGTPTNREFYKPLSVTYPVFIDISEAQCQSDFDCENNNYCNEETKECEEKPTESLTINSPEEKIYDSKRISFDVEADGNCDLEYSDYLIDFSEFIENEPNNEPPTGGRYSRLCRNCDEYNRTKSFKDGMHFIDLRCKDNYIFNSSRFFLVDSKKPRISKTYPKKNKYTNGSGFYIKYTEDYIESVKLKIYGDEGFLSSNVRGGSSSGGGGGGGGGGSSYIYFTLDCPSGKNQECWKNNLKSYLKEYNGDKIEYQFIVEDIAGNIDESKLTSVNVDTAPPVLENPELFWRQGEGRYNKYIYFDLEIDEDNLNEVVYSYIDSRGRLKETRLCSRLKNSVCEKRKRFSKGYHEIVLKIIDEAGNSVSYPVDFFVV